MKKILFLLTIFALLSILPYSVSRAHEDDETDTFTVI